MNPWKMAALLLLVVVASCIAMVEAGDLNEAIGWKKPSDLSEQFLATNDKPIMTIIHKKWCGACRHLKEELGKADATDFIGLSKDFVMVDAGDDDEPKEAEFAPDGGYIPRIIFSEPNGKVRQDVICQVNGNPSYKYFYHAIDQVTETMKHAKKVLSTAGAKEVDVEGTEGELEKEEL